MSATATATETQADSATTPQAGSTDAATTPTTPERSQAGQSTTTEAISLDEARKLRSEAKGLRDRLKKFEEAEAAAAAAGLSEIEKRDKRIAELEPQVTAAQARERQYALRDAIDVAVGAEKLAPVVTTARLLRLIDAEKVEWSETGEPTNTAALLKALAKSEPGLFARQRIPSADGGAGRGAGGHGTTMNDLLRAAARGGE